jgi:BlaI family penicillinase repressor
MEQIILTNTEWEVLNCLWEEAPKTVMQLVRELEERVGWAKGTTTTMIKRMEGKGFIKHQQGEKAKLYYPLINRKAATFQETKNFLKRVYQGNINMMMSAMAEHEEWSKEKIAELYSILEKKKRSCN